MSYVLRYHKLFNLGNFENESIDIERYFPDEINTVDALKHLKTELNLTRTAVALQEQKLARYQQLQQSISVGECQIEERKKEMDQLEKELEIRPVNPELQADNRAAL